MPTEEEAPDFEIVKEATSTPEKNGKYHIGETVTYKVTVTNTGNVTLHNIKVTDNLPKVTLISETDTIAVLAPGASASVEYSYIVRQLDVDRNKVVNIATAKPDEIGPKGNTKTVPVDDFNPAVSITKKIIGYTVDGNYTSLGDIGVDSITNRTIGTKITYKIIARNTGNVELSNFKVTDTSGSRSVYLESVQLPQRLVNDGISVTTGITVAGGQNLLGNNNITAQPGEEFTFIVSYVLQRADVTGDNYNKNIVNTAHDEGNYTYKDENGRDTTVTPKADDTAQVGTTYVVPRGKKEFVKVWNDTNYESARPTSITVSLLKNGSTVVNTKTLNATNNWKCEWPDIPLEEDNGTAITYTVREDVPTGYTASACTVNNNGQFTITNTYSKPQSVSVVKKYTETSTTTVKIPLDVVFILDTSNSMNNTDSGSTTSRAVNLVNAVNSTITELKKNGDNRIAIVGYSDTASLMLSLRKAENINANPVSLSGTTIRVSGGNSRSVDGGTYTQAGIALGAQQLTGNITRTVTLHGKTFTRVPVIILVSDGLPTYYTPSDAVARPTSDAGRLGDSISETVEQGYYTVRSAKYYKDQVTAKYRQTDSAISAKLYSIGINIGVYGQAVLDPSKIATCQNSTEVLRDSKGRYPNSNTYEAAKNFYKCFYGQKFTALVKNSNNANYHTSEHAALTALNTSYYYADESYMNNISMTDLANNMNRAINEATPKEMTIISTVTEINSGKVHLPDYNPATIPVIKVNGNNFTYNKADVIKQEGTEYYVLLAKLPANSNISISYDAK